MTDVPEAQPSPKSAASERLTAFGAALRALGDEHRARTGGAGHPRLRFALDDLLPSRVHAAWVYIEPREPADVDDLVAFLDALEATARAEAAHAGDPEELSEALTLALDDLHSYLLAHPVVDRRYRLFQGMGWPTRPPARSGGGTFRAEPGTVFRSGEPPVAAWDRSPDAHEYSLAA